MSIYVTHVRFCALGVFACGPLPHAVKPDVGITYTKRESFPHIHYDKWLKSSIDRIIIRWPAFIITPSRPHILPRYKCSRLLVCDLPKRGVTGFWLMCVHAQNLPTTLSLIINEVMSSVMHENDEPFSYFMRDSVGAHRAMAHDTTLAPIEVSRCKEA